MYLTRACVCPPVSFNVGEELIEFIHLIAVDKTVPKHIKEKFQDLYNALDLDMAQADAIIEEFNNYTERTGAENDAIIREYGLLSGGFDDACGWNDERFY